MKWIRSANLKKYDVIGAFSELNELDWRRSNFKIKKGDIVYIYVGVPYSKIMFKTICTEDAINFEDVMIDDSKFWVDKTTSDHVDEYIRLRLIDKSEKQELSLETLQKLGLIKGSIQGAFKSENFPKLYEYLENVFGKKDRKPILEVGKTNMIFHTISEALNFCFDANIDYRYQKGTYPAKKDAWEYYMAWFPHFAHYDKGELKTGSSSLDTNWYNIINDDGTEIIEYNYGESKTKYEMEENFYRLVFGKKKKEEYKFLGVFKMIVHQEPNIDYVYRRYKRVANIFDTGTILEQPELNIDKSYIEEIYNLPNVTTTEKEILVKARIGQGLFREKLLARHDEKCMVCGMKYKELLIASHIKEWSNANNDERLDDNNGLLLCTLHDSLFDKHLISFDEKGKVLISPKLDKHDMALCNISNETKIEMSVEMEKYMEYHRKKFYCE